MFTGKRSEIMRSRILALITDVYMTEQYYPGTILLSLRCQFKRCVVFTGKMRKKERQDPCVDCSCQAFIRDTLVSKRDPGTWHPPSSLVIANAGCAVRPLRGRRRKKMKM